MSNSQESRKFTDQAFRDELLTWLQERKTLVQAGLKTNEDPTLMGIMKGQLDSYLQVIAFVLTEGQLR